VYNVQLYLRSRAHQIPTRTNNTTVIAIIIIDHFNTGGFSETKMFSQYFDISIFSLNIELHEQDMKKSV